MKSNAAYILPANLDTESDSNNIYANFSKDDFDYYRITTYINLLENVLLRSDKLDIFAVIEEKDKEKIISEFNAGAFNIITNSNTNFKSILSGFSAKEFLTYKNNLILFSDVINFSSADIDKHLNLLSIDDKSLSISKSQYGMIKTFGFNNFSDDIIKHFIDSKLELDGFLSYNKSCAYFVNILPDLLELKYIDDFKKLYAELSLKSSNEYCSQKMHERFTNIFIEYKDLLK